MVRLVFRPYTQVRRSICTLESLRTSTRVSPGFVLLKHSSPSFGSQHVCSHSNLSPEGSWSVDSAAEASYLSEQVRLHINSALGDKPRALAHMLDSLVRVSRRDDKRHFVKVPPTSDGTLNPHRFETSPARRRKPDLLATSRTPRTRSIKKVASQHCLPSVPFQQFQVLFNSLFKVLFIFPSRYLFAIGLPPIFSFRWNLPPA